MSQPPGDPLVPLLDAVRQAKPVVALLGADPQGVSAIVDACVARLSDDPIRVVRVRGLPGVPLTLSRIVEEIGADQQGRAHVDDDELIVRVLAARGQGESQVVLILEQAELLPLPTLAFLQVALAVFGARTPRLQLLFAGHPKFAFLLDRDELTPLRDRLEVVVRVLPPLADPRSALATPQQAEPGNMAKPRSVAGRNRRRWAFALVPALLLVTAAAALAPFWRGTAPSPGAAPRPISKPPPAQINPPAEARSLPQDAQPPPMPPALPPQAQALPQDAQPSPAPALPPGEPPPSTSALPPQAQALPQDAQPSPAPALPPQAAEPAPTLPSPPSREADAAAPPPERRALPSNEQLTRLRGEFDRFLSQTEWGSKRLSENERSRLFNEYLRWNYGALAASPATPP